MPFPRDLSATERAVTWNLLEGAGLPELDVLSEQLAAAQVVSECACVCPTFSVAVDTDRARPTSYSGKPVATADYDGGSIMVWIENGWLSHVEIYWWLDEAPTSFPPLDQLSDHRQG